MAENQNLSVSFQINDEATQTLSTITRSLESTNSSIANVNKSLNQISPTQVQSVDASAGSLNSTLQNVSKSLSNVEKAAAKLQNASKAFSTMGSALKTAGKAASTVTAALTGITAKATSTATSFVKLYESSQVVFKQMLGSSEAAKDLYSDLLDVAKASTFSQETFLEAGKSLVGVGISAENTTQYLQAISDAVTGFGGDAQNIQQIAYAFRKVATSGKISMEEVNMMADGGINVLKILGNQYGVTASEMRDMISDGAVPAEEALAKLTEGIEKGTDGVNGMTSAMEGMSAAMKGKTLTGALDSMNSAIRTFSLNLVGMDPRTEAGQARINQLTAAIVTLNGIVEKSSPLFGAITDKIGQLLDKLIGAKPVFDEATGKWTQTDGILTRLSNGLDNLNSKPESLQRVANLIYRIGVSGPALIGLGKGFEIVAKGMDSLSKHEAALNKVLSFFGKGDKETKKKDTSSETKTQTETPKVSNVSNESILPQLTLVPESLKNTFGKIQDVFAAGRNTVKTAWNTLVPVMAEGASLIAKQMNLGPVGQGIAVGLDFIKNSVFSFALSFVKATPMLAAGALAIGGVTAAIGLLNQNGGGVEAVNGFFDNFLTGISNFTQNAVSAINSFAANIVTYAPVMVQRGIDLLGAIANGIGQAIPQLLSSAGQIAQALLNALFVSLPILAQGGVQVIQSLASGISTNLPGIVQSALDIIGQLAQGIVSNLPTIINTAIQIIQTLCSGLAQALPDLIVAAFNLVTQLAGAIITNFPQILSVGVQIVATLITGILDMAGALLEGVIQIGTSIVEGLWQGIQTAWGNFWSWIGEQFGGIIDFVKDIFGVHSPSDVFSEIGGFLVSGLQQGLENAWNGLMSAAQGLWNGFLSIFGGGNNEQEAPATDYSQVIGQTQSQLSQLESFVNESLGRINAAVTSNMAVILQTVPQTFAALPAAIEPVLAGLIAIISQQSGALGTAFVTTFSASLLAGGAQIQAVLSQVFNAAIASVFTDLTTQTLQSVSALSVGTIGQISALGTQTIAIIGALSLNVAASFAQMTGSSLQTVATFAVTVPTLLATLVAQVTADMAALSMNMTNLWNAIKNTVVSVVNDLSSQITSKIDTMATNIVNRLSRLKSEFNTIAIAAMTAFKTGIEQSTGGVLTTASNVVQKLKQVFEEGLGVHSPADYMIWLGQMLLEGLILGLSGDKLQKFIDSMIGDMQSSFENGNFDANSTVNFLSDQGTLDLIGRVTKMDLGGAKAESIAYPLIGTMGTISSWFGNRPASDTGGIGSTNHGGIDIAASTGTPIAAAIGGTVTTASMSDGYGNLVVIDSGNGLETYYGHMSQIMAQAGQTVTKGQQIGLVGSTGNSTGPHLHFEMRQNDNKIDPYPYLQGAQVSAGNTLASVLQNAYNLKHGIVTGMQSLGNVNYDISAGAAQWTDLVLQALSMLGQPADLLQGVLYAIENESGGNPNAINDWDSNAAAGDPSRGLLQTIGSTFEAYRNPNLSNNIYDPLANIYAGLNYMIQRYGSVAAVVIPRLGGWYGYASGTDYATPGLHWVGENGPELLQFRGGERVYTNSQSNRIAQSAAANYESLNYDRMIENAVTYGSVGSGASSTNTVSNNNKAEITINVMDYSDIPNLTQVIYETVTQAVEDEAYTTSGTASNF